MPLPRRAFFGLSLLAIHGGLLAYSAVRDGPTTDEIGHLPSGLSHWRLGRFELYRVNPPLVRMVAALPLLAMDVRTDWSAFASAANGRPEFPIGTDFIKQNNGTFGRLFAIARWACLPFSLVGGFVCWKWSSQLYGSNAGLVALSLWCFCPNLLAHGHLITPDAGATALGLTAGYAFWRWLYRPSWKMTILCGVVLGLTELTKATWIILFPAWVALTLFWRSRHTYDAPGLRVSRTVRLIAILLIAIYVLNAGYGFVGTCARLRDYSFICSALRSPHPTKDTLKNRFASTLLGSMRVPFPKDYVLGIDTQKGEFEAHYWSYCRGRWIVGGWYYYYYPYALAIKEPTGYLVAALIAGASSFVLRPITYRQRQRPHLGRLASPADAVNASATWCDEVVLLVPAACVMLLVSSQTGMNHHMRYVLPAVPFLYIWISKAGRLLDAPRSAGDHSGGAGTGRCNVALRRTMSMLFIGSLVWGAASSLSVYPHSLSFFNELVGGPRRGHLFLGSSNVDWGQDLWRLHSWCKQHNEACPLFVALDVRLIQPQVVGIDCEAPPPGPAMNRPGLAITRAWPWSNDPTLGSFTVSTPHQSQSESRGPLPGWFIVSVNQIHELSGTLEYFQEFDVVDRIGYTLNVYHVSLDDANRLRKKLRLPLLRPELRVPPPQT